MYCLMSDMNTDNDEMHTNQIEGKSNWLIEI